MTSFISSSLRQEVTTAEALSKLKPILGKPLIFSMGVGGSTVTSDAFFQKENAACLYDGPGAGDDTSHEQALAVATRICEQSIIGKIEQPLINNTFIALTIDNNRLSVAAGDGMVVFYYQDINGVISSEVVYANVELDSGRVISVKQDGVQSNTYLPGAYQVMAKIVPHSLCAFSKKIVTETRHMVGIRVASDGIFETFPGFNSDPGIGEENATRVLNSSVLRPIEVDEAHKLNALMYSVPTLSEIMSKHILPSNKPHKPLDDITDVYIPLLLKY